MQRLTRAGAGLERHFRQLTPGGGIALLRQTGTHAFAWIASDLNAHGVVGNASIATAEKGQLTADFQAHGFVTLLKDVRKAKLADCLS